MKKFRKLRNIKCFVVTVFTVSTHSHVDYYVDCVRFQSWCETLPKDTYVIVTDMVSLNKPYLTFMSGRCIELDNDPLIKTEKL